MSEEITYLELSEANSHKFYEVKVAGTQVTIRYGRIGDAGQSSSSNFPTPEKAVAEANKKINEKIKKGYERAVQGVRQKRAVTRRTAMFDAYADPAPARSSGGSSRAATPAPSAVKRAPIIWNFDSGSCAFGVFVDENLCWVGNEAGNIFALNHDGSVNAKYRLPEGVKCIVADGDWLYAGCDDGNVYDLSGKAPRAAYRIADNVDIYWLDIYDGILAVSDENGRVTVINHEDESQWTKKSKSDRGWMVRCDEIGVYHGHRGGVTMYDWEDGTVIWHRDTPGDVLFGWQEETMVYACTSLRTVHAFTKKGEAGADCQCDGAVFSCATSPDGKLIFAGDINGWVYCFDETGKRLWKLATGCGQALSMQYFQEKLYIVTRNGSLACIDASEAAITAASQGTVPLAVAITAPKNIAATVVSTTVDTTSDSSTGVIVECYREGSELRVRVVSEGFEPSWHCQFPKDVREEGARYVVDEVREASRGGFYRVRGNIRKLVEG